MTTPQWLFYAWRLGNCVYCTFIFTFFSVVPEGFLQTVIWYQVFLSNTNNLHTVVWFQVFLSNTNNYVVLSNFYLIKVLCLHSVVWF